MPNVALQQTGRCGTGRFAPAIPLDGPQLNLGDWAGVKGLSLQACGSVGRGTTWAQGSIDG